MTIDHTIKILLVEDSTFVRRAARKNLNALGFQSIIEAEDGDDAAWGYRPPMVARITL